MSTLRQQHDDLNNKVNETYRNLIDKIGNIILYEVETDEFDEEIIDCECISYINRNGDTVDARILIIDKTNGIFVAKDEDDSKRFWVSLNDLSSLHDKISVVELLEDSLTK